MGRTLVKITLKMQTILIKTWKLFAIKFFVLAPLLVPVPTF